MSANTTSPQALLAETEIAQSAASDPIASAWVSANAGAGKTHVLKMRVLRLLLAGTPPERILCLTYTKAAAAEMSARVFADLATWTTAADSDLDAVLAKLLGYVPQHDERLRARRLFAAAIETPGGLKVQTIHAFCERLLQRFPLEAGVPPGFQILDDDLGAKLRRQAIDDMLRTATSDCATPLGYALAEVIKFATGDNFDEILGRAISKRPWLDAMARLDLTSNDDELAVAEALYRNAFDVSPDADAKATEQALADTLSDADLHRLISALNGGSKNDQKAAERAAAVLAAPSKSLRIDALTSLLLTGEGLARSSLMTKAVKQSHPDLEPLVQRVTDRFLLLDRTRRALTLLAANMALIRLAMDVLQRYSDAKAARAALDFDDLIERTKNLLSSADATTWVLFKLDGGLDHILVDEAQDTSPVQWAVIESLAHEFFTGTGTADIARTLFAVGDEKQSIYSFQGAAPKMFAATGKRFQAITTAANLAWRTVPLQLSFRSVAPVLDAVDRVFAAPERTPGVTSDAVAIRHVALRTGQAGLVEVWPTLVWDEVEESDPWSPQDEVTTTSPAIRVAARIADTIAHWLKSGERLTSQNRPVRPGDILILVRKRQPFANPMVAALKARGIPVAGTDRMSLTQQIAVQDLIALCDFLCLPEDDLALATVLKSPLFDLDDDDLIAIAPGRKGTLWSAVIDAAKVNSRFKSAAETLKKWRGEADFMPPFEFLANLLDRDGCRARLLRRLGPDAADPIDELVNLALTYDDRAPPSLQGFLDWLKSGSREIKRDMEQTRDEVRVMTVHGAKGLEAPIVFLPDTCSSGTRRKAGELVELMEAARPQGVPPLLAWVIKGAGRIDQIAYAKIAADALEQEEHLRLLYVALTRPRDRLYIAGFEAKTGRAKGCWYDLIAEGLGSALVGANAWDGNHVRRLEAQQTAPHEVSRQADRDDGPAAPLPDWAKRPAPREPGLTMPLAPSRLAPLEADDSGEPIDIAAPPASDSPSVADLPSPSPLVQATGDRFLRGTLTHALLEHLPSLDPAVWDNAAVAYVATRGAALSAATRASIASESLTVLRDSAFAAVFGPDSRPEVPLIAEIANPRGRGPALRISGQIDRLVRHGDEILIVDYKTNRPPPLNVADVPAAYLFQLAAYRLGLQHVFGDMTVRAAIIWTDGARLMPIPDAMLDEHERQLWKLDAARLDA